MIKVKIISTDDLKLEFVNLILSFILVIVFSNLILFQIDKMSFRLLTRLTVTPVGPNCVRRCSSHDQPVPDMENPYKKKSVQCILCKYKIELNYKVVYGFVFLFVLQMSS